MQDCEMYFFALMARFLQGAGIRFMLTATLPAAFIFMDPLHHLISGHCLEGLTAIQEVILTIAEGTEWLWLWLAVFGAPSFLLLVACQESTCRAGPLLHRTLFSVRPGTTLVLEVTACLASSCDCDFNFSHAAKCGSV